MARAKPFGRFLFFPQIAQICTDAVRVFLVFPQIAQICTDAVRGGLIPQIAPRRGRCHRCRSGCFLLSRRLRRFAQMPVRGASCFPHRLRRWRQGVSVSFVTMLHVTCYNKVVPYCAGWAYRKYIVYIIYILYILYIFYTPKIQASERRCGHTEGAYCNM